MKESTCQEMQEIKVLSWVRRFPWRRKWQPPILAYMPTHDPWPILLGVSLRAGEVFHPGSDLCSDGHSTAHWLQSMGVAECPPAGDGDGHLLLHLLSKAGGGLPIPRSIRLWRRRRVCAFRCHLHVVLESAQPVCRDRKPSGSGLGGAEAFKRGGGCSLCCTGMVLSYLGHNPSFRCTGGDRAACHGWPGASNGLFRWRQAVNVRHAGCGT